MRVRLVLVLLAGLLALSCGKAKKTEADSYGRTETPGRDSGGQDLSVSPWKEFTSKEGSFFATFPAPVKLLSHDNQYDFGKVAIRAYVSSPGRNRDFRVAVHNYPGAYVRRIEPERLIEIMRDGMAENVKGKLEGMKKVSLDSYPGQEFTVRGFDPLTGGPLTMRLRLFAVGTRVYQLTVTAPSSDKVLKGATERFFDTFRLLRTFQPAQLVGKWELVKAGTLSEPGSVLEFAEDGRLKLTSPSGSGPGPSTLNTTYKLDGDKLTIRRLMVSIIKTLTDTTVILKDERGRTLELTRLSGGKNADKLVGTWESTGGVMPAGSVVEFTGDGKMRMSIKQAGGGTYKAEGTYKVNGDKLITTGLAADGKAKSGADTIKKLTDKELVIEEDGGQTVQLKRVK